MATTQQQATDRPTTEEVELLRGSVQATVVAQFVIAIAAAIGLIYFLKLVLVTILISALLAFALDPLVVVLAKIRMPRALGSAIAVLLLIALSLALIFFFYSRAIDFLNELPQYSATIRENLEKLEAQAEKLENSTRSLIPAGKGKKPIPVQVQSPGLANLISSTASQFVDIALAISFVPFLIYFMLTWKSHIHSATLAVFPKEKRLVAYRTIGRISEMVRSFIVGNLMVGLLNALVSTIIFGYVHLPYFYFL
jgi:predicted PurR-regulated permease PerM